jgi:hypothetical protein
MDNNTVYVVTSIIEKSYCEYTTNLVGVFATFEQAESIAANFERYRIFEAIIGQSDCIFKAASSYCDEFTDSENQIDYVEY